MPRRGQLAAIALVAATGCERERQPNVVLIVIDALRKDALHVYGNALPDAIQDSGEALNGAAFAWFAQQATVRPFFLYLYYMDVHQPYRPLASDAERFVAASGGALLDENRAVPGADPRDLACTHATYQACVAHAEALVAALLAKLDDLDLRDDTLVVLTADHGEEFGEHGGIGHGRTIYGEVVRVPLVMAWPGRIEPGHVTHLSQHLDLAPTILSLVGLDAPPSFAGRSVFEPADAVILEMARWRGVAAGTSKWIFNPATGVEQLFALSDELDREPRDEPSVAAPLRAQLESYLAGAAQRPAIPVADRVGAQWSEDEQQRLRALGYTQ